MNTKIITNLNEIELLYKSLNQIFNKFDMLAENPYENKQAQDIIKRLEYLGCKIRHVDKNDPLNNFASPPPPFKYKRPEVTLENGTVLRWLSNPF